MDIKTIEEREVLDRKMHKDDSIVLNYTGSFNDYGDTIENGIVLPHGILWEYLTRYRMLIKLANIKDVNGYCAISKNAMKYDNALELGCDWGHCFEAINAIASNVYGVEVMQSSVDLGLSLGRNIKHGIIENIPYDDNMFDVVISNHVLEHSSDINKTIGEICRVTKPNGWSIHTLPFDIDKLNLSIGGFHLVDISKHELIELFAMNDFNYINSFYLWNHDKEDLTFIFRRQ